jgi:large-conductance mechanosensitive channel
MAETAFQLEKGATPAQLAAQFDVTQLKQRDVIQIALIFLLITAFATVILTLVRDIILPPVSLVIDIPDYKWTLRPATATHPAVNIPIGHFLEVLLTATLIGAIAVGILFWMQRRNPKPQPEPKTKDQIVDELQGLLDQLKVSIF